MGILSCVLRRKQYTSVSEYDILSEKGKGVGKIPLPSFMYGNVMADSGGQGVLAL